MVRERKDDSWLKLILQYSKTKHGLFNLFNLCFKFSFLVCVPKSEVWLLETTEKRNSATLRVKLWKHASHVIWNNASQVCYLTKLGEKN